MTPPANIEKLTSVVVIVVIALFISGCEKTPKPDEPKAEVAADEKVNVSEVLAQARAAYDEKDWGTAEQHYRQVTAALPQESHPWFRLGNIFARTERPDLAVAAYKEALIREPELSKAWFNMGLVQIRQAANSFSQMRTYTEEGSAERARADAMYGALVEFIQSDNPTPESQ